MPFGSLLSGGLSLAGGLFGSKRRDKGYDKALQASQPYNVNTPFGGSSYDPNSRTVNTSIAPSLMGSFNQFNQAGLDQLAYANVNPQEFTNRYFNMINSLAAPSEYRAREQERGTIHAQGRGGTSSGLFQMANLLANQDTARNQRAILAETEGFNRQQSLFGQAQNLFGTAMQVPNYQLGLLTAAMNQGNTGAANIYAKQGETKGDDYASFFSSLADTLGGLFK